MADYGSAEDGSLNAIKLFKAFSEQFVESPLKEGCALNFRVGRYNRHVGFYLGSDEFIHAWEGEGMVVIDRLSGVWNKRLVGTYEIKR